LTTAHIPYPEGKAKIPQFGLQHWQRMAFAGSHPAGHNTTPGSTVDCRTMAYMGLGQVDNLVAINFN
jgi:hypothetical protein